MYKLSVIAFILYLLENNYLTAISVEWKAILIVLQYTVNEKAFVRQ